jgi:hypothetical protein
LVSTVNITLTSDGWSSAEAQQVVTVQSIDTTTTAVVLLSQEITLAQYSAWIAAMIVVTAQGEGTLTFTALGAAPVVDIPLYILTFGA